MNPFTKHCPDCAAPISFGRYWRLRSRTAVCAACGSEYLTCGFGRQMFASATGSLFFSVPLTLGIHDHRWWWAAIPGIVLFAVYSLLLARPQSQRAPAREPVR